MLTYIDLFCGIGGFHQGIERVAIDRGIETKCIFAADIDNAAAKVYKLNYGIDANFDLMDKKTHKKIDEEVKKNGDGLDFVFGGFPCQSFSHAGNQEGFGDKTKGTLFFEIKKIVKTHTPKYILLENVRNLKSHDEGKTWNTIKETLEKLGYTVDFIIMSPNQIENKSIPALRNRVFIMCYRNDLTIDKCKLFNGLKKDRRKTTIYSKHHGEYTLKKNIFKNDHLHDVEDSRLRTMEMWEDFRNRILSTGNEMISPIWTHYFDEFDISEEPKWKQKIINRNRKFYKNNKDTIDKWLYDYRMFFNSLNASDKKFEWNAGDEINSIYDGIIQFRPSGVRVKRPDYIPTLVAINQTPIIGKEKRYMTTKEMSKLYGFKKLKFGDQSEKQTYKQLGNTVSVDVVEYLINHMFDVTNF